MSVGNIIRGVPLTESGDLIVGSGPSFGANLLVALNPYGIIIGLLGLVWTVLHGAAWLAVKTTGGLYDRSRSVRARMLVVFAGAFALATAATVLLVPEAFFNVTASIFPALVPSLGPGESLTIANSASSPLTLTVMLIIAAIGMPLVLGYFFVIYRTYAGRIDPTDLGEAHY